MIKSLTLHVHVQNLHEQRPVAILTFSIWNEIHFVDAQLNILAKIRIKWQILSTIVCYKLCISNKKFIYMIKNLLQSARWSDRSIGNLPCPVSEKVCSTMKQNISIPPPPPAKIPLFQRLHYILDKNVTLDLRWSTYCGRCVSRSSVPGSNLSQEPPHNAV